MKTSALSRRHFLQQACVAATVTGSAPILPNLLLGAEGQVKPSNRESLACIALGIQGTNNMKTFLGHPEVRVTAVCDVHETQRSKAKKVIDDFYGNQDCAVFRDFRELIARADIDAVQITTPDHWHALIALEAARHGKHMYQE